MTFGLVLRSCLAASDSPLVAPLSSHRVRSDLQVLKNSDDPIKSTVLSPILSFKLPNCPDSGIYYTPH